MEAAVDAESGGSGGSRPPPPGWYADPTVPGVVRWWDGVQWTAHESSVYPGARGPDPVRALAQEHTMVRWARIGIWILASYPVVIVTFMVVFVGFIAPSRTDAAFGSTGFAGFLAFEAMVVVVGILELGALVAVLLWAYAAATHARDLRYPAALSPMWAVFGWFVPVVQYWFPYQSIRDAFHPANPARREVLHWWLMYVLGPLSTFVALPVGAFVGTFGGAMWFVLPLVTGAAATYAVFEARLGRRVVDALTEDHEKATARVLAGLSAL